jgi:scyllo-inositol 2-dehydrogenase (NADP+)
MKKPITTALLAYGLSGKVFHAPFLHTNKGFDFYAVLERKEKKASLDHPQIKSFSSIDTLLKDENIELVVVNTPNNTHFEYAKQVLEANKHVLIEKPATTNVVEFMELLELSKKVNKNIFVYQNRRWSSDFVATKKVIDSGKLGEIIEVHLRFDRYRPQIGMKAFKETPVAGSGILYDLGSHLLDQSIALFGKPKSVNVKKASYRNDSQVDDYANISLVFENNINVTITASMLVVNPQNGIVIHGTKGSFVKPFCDEQENQLMQGMAPIDKNYGLEKPENFGILSYYNNYNELITQKIISEKGNYNALFDAVFETIRFGKEFPVKNKEILEQIKIISIT